MAAAGGAFGGSRGLQPRPPEKGVFPLDHFGECKDVKEEYMECLKKNEGEASKCTVVARKYLECRMKKDLMAEQSLEELGFREEQHVKEPSTQNNSNGQDINNKLETRRSREKTGFLAGSRFYSKD